MLAGIRPTVVARTISIEISGWMCTDQLVDRDRLRIMLRRGWWIFAIGEQLDQVEFMLVLCWRVVAVIGHVMPPKRACTGSCRARVTAKAIAYTIQQRLILSRLWYDIAR